MLTTHNKIVSKNRSNCVLKSTTTKLPLRSNINFDTDIDFEPVEFFLLSKCFETDNNTTHQKHNE